MTSPADVPQGIVFNRGGCTGVQATPVRTVVAGARLIVAARPTPIQNLLANRPRLFGRTTAGVGCSGTRAASYSSTSVATTTTTVAQRLPVATVGSPAVATVGGVFGERDRVERQLRRALSRSNSPEAKRALADPDVFRTLSAKVHREISKAAVSSGGTVSRIGDGTLFDKFISALPTLIAALEKIIAIIDSLT